MKALLLTVVAFILVTTTARRVNPTKFHKRRHLMDLSRKDHQEMFVPILDADTNSYSHHVHVEDEQNKHFEFHFEATLRPNTHVLSLNHEEHRSNITNVICSDHHMRLYPTDVNYYHEHIQTKLGSKKEVFIPDVCDKHSTKIRRIHSIHKDDDSLFLASVTADHLEMYDEYFFEFKSDAPVRIHHDTDNHDVTRRRRLWEEKCDPPELSLHDDEGLAAH
eukprot:157468_1